MKKYTIKEFAEGKKAVKIENEEQWNKLDKVHKLTFRYFPNSPYYLNNKEHSASAWYLNNNDWEILEFSQLDFEDEFVVGKWYKCLCNDNFYCYKRSEDGDFASSSVISPRGTDGFTKGYNDRGRDSHHISYFQPDNIASLKEIQQYLPSNHPDLIKKDTFVLPGFWYVVVTEENKEVLERWRFPDRKYNLNDYIGGIVGISPKYPNTKSHNPSPNDSWGEGSIEITFEQFRQYVLKEKTMEKEIIGYKLVKSEYEEAVLKIVDCNKSVWDHNLKESGWCFSKHSLHSSKLKEAGVLDLWFEPVYAPEYKVGDWISFSNATRTKTITSKLKEWTAHNYCILENDEKPFKDIIRKATEEEIKTQLIEVFISL